ncbi:MAG: hypothetical protein Q9206_002866 [Seirophora lacunosa]
MPPVLPRTGNGRAVLDEQLFFVILAVPFPFLTTVTRLVVDLGGSIGVVTKSIFTRPHCHLNTPSILDESPGELRSPSIRARKGLLCYHRSTEREKDNRFFTSVGYSDFLKSHKAAARSKAFSTYDDPHSAFSLLLLDNPVEPRYGKLAGRLPRFESIEPDLDHFQPGDIVYDRRFPAAPVHYDIYKRQDAVNVDQSSKGGGAASTAQKHLRFSSTSTARPAAATTEAAFTTASLPASKSTSSQSGEPTLLVTAPGTESSSLPRPFDTGLGNNYTHPNCPVFMNNFLRNETFVSCVPFSLLLQNSMSFFSSTKSLPAITRTLDATCAVRDPNACNTHLSSIASQLRQDSNCGSDYRRQQPLVLAAYNGLVSYSPLFRAGCERDPESGNYCFANAIQNKTSPSDSYPYYLPLGIPLPGGSQPTCSDCLRRTMDIFHESVQERGQQGPLMTNYAGAAQLVNVGCGPSFSNQTVAASAGQSSFAAPTLALPSSSVKLLAFVLLASAGVWL